MNIRVKLFSIVKEIAGCAEQTVEIAPEADTADLFRQLMKQHPALEQWEGSVRMAVNCVYVPLNHPLKEGDEVAIIPPVSGG